MRLNLLLAGALLAGVSMPAQAARMFDFSFSGPGDIGDPVAGTGTLTTDDGTMFKGWTTYAITGISGFAGFEADRLTPITGLLGGFGEKIVGSAYTLTEDDGGAFRLDQLAFTVDGPLNFYSISRLSSSARLLSAATTTFGYLGTNGEVASFNVSFTLAPSISAVPEPAAWALMIGGFGVVGGAMRTRRRTTAAVAA